MILHIGGVAYKQVGTQYIVGAVEVGTKHPLASGFCFTNINHRALFVESTCRIYSRGIRQNGNLFFAVIPDFFVFHQNDI